jgi:hypothetical protein
LSLVAPVASPVFQLDAYNCDGANNLYRANGAQLRTWFDGGASSPPVLTSASVYERPHFKADAASGENCVAFDGIDDRLTFPSSDVSFAFIHTTGIFDLFVGLRMRGTATRSVFGNMTNTATDKGMSLNLDGTGKPTIAIGNGAASIIFVNATFELQLPKFTPSKLLIRGDGSKLYVSSNFYAEDFESAAFTGSLGSGNAARTFTIGSSSAAEAPSGNTMLQSDLFFASLYNRNLNAAELLTMSQAIRSRAGQQA